jgi:hypothetical protein
MIRRIGQDGLLFVGGDKPIVHLFGRLSIPRFMSGKAWRWNGPYPKFFRSSRAKLCYPNGHGFGQIFPRPWKTTLCGQFAIT